MSQALVRSANHSTAVEEGLPQKQLFPAALPTLAQRHTLPATLQGMVQTLSPLAQHLSVLALPGLPPLLRLAASLNTPLPSLLALLPLPLLHQRAQQRVQEA